VVTIGTGGIGLNCIQGAAICGSKVNIAVDLVDEKIQAALQLGATHGINPGNGDINDEIERLTDGRGADYVFVAAGSAAAVEQALTLVRRAGMVVLVGMTAQGVTAQFETLNLANDAIQLIGSKMGQTHLDTDIPRLVEHYLEGSLKLDELVSECYPLEGINDAITAAKEGQALRNVIVFDS
jgi:S-(hydroxymethyl)glutathione dehydrogenase/alcohol dehydrogenase